ncbi:MAG: hypothetical protein ACRYHQ_05365 [Janthinobacterium lividum]
MTPATLRAEALFDRVALIHDTPEEAVVVELEIADAEVLLGELTRALWQARRAVAGGVGLRAPIS